MCGNAFCFIAFFGYVGCPSRLMQFHVEFVVQLWGRLYKHANILTVLCICKKQLKFTVLCICMHGFVSTLLRFLLVLTVVNAQLQLACFLAAPQPELLLNRPSV